MHNSSAGFQPEGPTISRRSVYAMFWPPSQIKTGFAAFRVHPGIVGRKVQRLRSEEHTSELQSLMRNSYAVFCLKNKSTHHNNETLNISQTLDTSRTKHKPT